MLNWLLHPANYLAIFLFIAATGCGMPIPEEAAIVVAGVLSSQHQLYWPYALAACLAGAIVGDSFMYAIGYRWGHGIFTSHPRFAKLFAAENEKQFQKAVEAHALKVMLVARFLVGIRAPVYVMTGVVRLPYRRFLLYDLLSASLVVGTVFGLSYWFGEQVAGWVKHAEIRATIVVVLIVIAAVAILYYRHREQVLNMIFGRDVPPAES
ncbi:MAG TPA: DedA family protein [Lacipirellulaceae bacterium]|nr:DedA family protein [Lacipirellulaceae bacterium]